MAQVHVRSKVTPLADPDEHDIEHGPAHGAAEAERAGSGSSSSQTAVTGPKPPSAAGLRPPDQDGAFRRVVFNDPGANALRKFCNNVIITSKYTLWNFIPKNLFEQFRRIANIYFLVIAILQVSTDLSPTYEYSTLIPLCIVLGITMIKEGYEDWKRHKSDHKVNMSVAKVLRGGVFVDVLWKHVVVGDVLRVENKQDFPTDLLILASSEDQGVAFIETSNLDGETNLKIRQALDATAGNVSPDQISALRGAVEYELPNNKLYNFDGTLHLGADRAVPIDIKNIALRGAVLRNTHWIYGLAIFTGKETKLMQNSRAAPSKRSNVERTVNILILIIFCSLFILCSVSTIVSSIWVGQNQNTWYLPFLQGQTAGTNALYWITFLILYNNLVPISLYVSMELVKLYQAQLIDSDEEMYNAETDTPALARTSNLNEDLGQIQYIFSDKTGTLTRNEMEFRKCTIGGLAYGTSLHPEDDAPKPAPRKGDPTAAPAPGPPPPTVQPVDETEGSTSEAAASEAGGAGFHFADPRLLQHLRQGAAPDAFYGTHVNAALVHDFLTCVGVCHTVIPERTEGGRTVYQAASPDEGALVHAARCLGYAFVGRNAKGVQLNVAGRELFYEVLNVCEFNSTRKRMSVVVRAPDARIVLYTKGADSVVLERSAACPFGEALQEHLRQFATDGLRTLVLARRELEEEEWAEWNERFHAAATALAGREEKLEAAAEEIEKELEIIGASAIEDKLQEGVPDAIATLAAAGMKIWVLTGDKQETAINIGYACRLLTQRMSLIVVNEETRAGTEEALTSRLNELRDQLGTESETLALVIDGKSLTFVFGDRQLESMLLELGKLCKAVVACRVSPLQKAQVVRLVKTSVRPTPMTLAIGDGANDVSMIQEAHVGIGISGKEGMQAVRASDYAIGQFRFLKRLLLVHGRWNYKRISRVILYSFYKNMINVLTLFYFGFYNGNSGTTLYESWLGVGWNVGWTFLPIIFLGVLDQDVSARAAQDNPALYLPGQWNTDFNAEKMLAWVLNAAVHSCIVFFLALGVWYEDAVSHTGAQGGLFSFGTAVNMCLMLTVNFKVALETCYWTAWTHAVTWGSVALWYAFVVVYSLLLPISWDFYYVGFHVFATPVLWFCALLIPIVAVSFDIAAMYLRRTYFPTPLEIVQEVERGLADERITGTPGEKATYEARAAALARWTALAAREQERVLPRLVRLRNSLPKLPAAIMSSDKKIANGASAPPPPPPAAAVPIMGSVGAAPLEEDEAISMTGSLQLHPVTLRFIGRDDLERAWREDHVRRSLRFSRAALGVALALFVGYLFVDVFLIGSGVSDFSRLVVRACLLVMGILIFGFTFTQSFRRYFQSIISSICWFTGISKTLLITDSGVLGVAIFPVFLFLVVRLRFVNALILTVIDLIVYNAFVLIREIMPFWQLLRFNFFFFLTFMFSAYSSHKIESAVRRDFLLQRVLKKEREKSLSILENMLPPHVAQRMRHGEGVIANEEKCVSILFCNILDFPNLVVNHSPQQLVSLLDRVYSTFDSLSELHVVQKMETVGPTYMACAGLQDSRSDHAIAVAEMAHDMLAGVKAYTTKFGEPIKVRVGIHTGRVISGVVGYKKPQYCLFGDTVNTSSRMQSTGVEGRIQVSAASLEFLKDDYVIEPRSVQVKGKGEMKTYLLGPRKRPLRHAHAPLGPAAAPTPAAPGAPPAPAASTADTPTGKRPGKGEEGEEEEENASAEITQMNPVTLSFSGQPEQEESYASEQKRRTMLEIRFGAVMVVLGYIVYSFTDYTNDSSPGEVLRSTDSATFTVVLSVRCAFIALVLLFLLASYAAPRFARFAQLSTSLFALCCQLVIITINLIQRRQYEHRIVLASMVFVSLIFNGAGLRFINATIINVIALILWNILAKVFIPSSLWISQSSDSLLYNSFFLLCCIAFNMMASYDREFYQRRKYCFTRLLKQETAKSDELLHQMLPNAVVKQLKEGRTVIADEFKDITLLFSDIVGFTSLASRTTPEKVVALLSQLFSAFDRLTETHGVYKVQTIGDAYVVAAGIPVVAGERERQRNAAENAEAMALMARDMHREVARICTDDIDAATGRQTQLRMRIGLHSGRIVAGVIGTKKLRYDIWGGDVLTANSMEEHGIPGRIVVSEKARAHLLARDAAYAALALEAGSPPPAPRFRFSPHETVVVKGLGPIATFALKIDSDGDEEDEAPAAAAAPAPAPAPAAAAAPEPARPPAAAAALPGEVDPTVDKEEDLSDAVEASAPLF